MKYLSLFSGIGGFEIGIQKAYENLSKTKGTQQRRISQDSTNNEQTLLGTEQPTCIGYSEIDKYAIQIYEKQFTKRFPYCSDCWEKEKKERKLLTERESIKCESSEDCINCGKPASLLFNIKPKNYGDITKIIASELPDFDLLVGGFPCQAFSIAGKRGGFDDTRGTLFFDVARILKEKQPRNFILENVKGLLSHDNGRTFKTIINTLAELGYCVEWQVLNAKNFGVPQNRERVFIVGHLRGTPRPKVFPIQGNSSADFSGVSIIDGYNRKRSKEVGAVRQNMLNGGSLIDNNNSIRRPTHPTNIRRLTPLECERLQGFPDGWTEGISDTQRYKTLGNGIVSNVVEEVMSGLLKVENKEE